MTWFKVDDSFHSNAKVLAASPAALGLWVVAGSWSAQNLTEGFVPSHVLPRLMPRADRFATELIKVGLWERAENGFQFHDWTAYNPTRSEALAVKERQSSGGAIGNHRRWHEAKGKVDPTCRYCRNGHRPPDRSTDRSTDQSGESVASRPSRPDPSRPERDGGTHGAESEGDQSVHARARAREALRWLSANYGLTDLEAARAWEVAEARARDTVKNPVRYLQRMAERGHLADIVGAIQTAAPDPAAQDEPEPEPPPLRAIEGNASSSGPADTQSPLIQLVHDEQPEPEPLPFYEPDGPDERTAAPLIADLKRKWSTGS